MLCPYNMNVVLRFLGFVGGGNSGSSENSFSGKWKSSDEIPSDKTSSNGLRSESAKNILFTQQTNNHHFLCICQPRALICIVNLNPFWCSLSTWCQHCAKMFPVPCESGSLCSLNLKFVLGNGLEAQPPTASCSVRRAMQTMCWCLTLWPTNSRSQPSRPSTIPITIKANGHEL